MRAIMLGAPGSGKGTQGRRLASRFEVAHIASGDLLRAEVDNRSDLGRRVSDYLDSGRLVPDELVSELVLRQVRAAAEAGGYVLDGFPRSVAQAVQAEETLAESDACPELVIYLVVPQRLLVQRLLERADGSGRSDDTLEVITDRLRVFESETRPLVDHYRDLGLLREVKADGTVDEVTAAVMAAL